MDLQEIKKRALEWKQKAQKKGEEALDYSAQKLVESRFSIKTKEELKSFIEKSAETKFVEKQTGKEKKYSHKIIILVGEPKSKFFKEALYALPILATKGFTQNIPIKLMTSTLTGANLGKYGVKDTPCAIIFENKKVYKIIVGNENIGKLVKSLSLDINKLIDTI